jgi:hypothetical protein
MEQKVRTLLSALVEAQDAVESNRPLRTAAVKRILDELMRTRRLLAATEEKLERERRKHEGVGVHGDGRTEGATEGSRVSVGRSPEDVDSEHG